MTRVEGPADGRARRTAGPGGRQGPADGRARRKWLALDRLIAAIPVISRNLDPSDRQHTRVVDAILAGDAATSRPLWR